MNKFEIEDIERIDVIVQIKGEDYLVVNRTGMKKGKQLRMKIAMLDILMRNGFGILDQPLVKIKEKLNKTKRTGNHEATDH
jgi:hypothetical protein